MYVTIFVCQLNIRKNMMKHLELFVEIYADAFLILLRYYLLFIYFLLLFIFFCTSAFLAGLCGNIWCTFFNTLVCNLYK
jgi:hypothetical protein